MNRPTRTTIVYALAGGCLVVPAAMLLAPYLHWTTALKLTLWADLALYAVLLCRWSRTPLTSILFPLVLLLGTALWPRTYAGFFFLAVGVLSWIRSGICFKAAPLRALAGEVLTVLGGTGLVMVFGGYTSVSWAVGICLFTLVQALYFFIVPSGRMNPGRREETADTFERAAREARSVLDGY